MVMVVCRIVPSLSHKKIVVLARVQSWNWNRSMPARKSHMHLGQAFPLARSFFIELGQQLGAGDPFRISSKQSFVVRGLLEKLFSLLPHRGCLVGIGSGNSPVILGGVERGHVQRTFRLQRAFLRQATRP